MQNSKSSPEVFPALLPRTGNLMKNHAHDYGPLTGKGGCSAVIEVTTNQPALKSGSLGWANTKNRGLFKALLTAAASKTGTPTRLRGAAANCHPGSSQGARCQEAKRCQHIPRLIESSSN